MRVLWWGWKADLAAATEYRVDLIGGTVVSTIWLAVSATPTLLLAAHSTGAGGWTLPRLLFLQAVWYLMDAVIWMLLMVNIAWLADQVQLGQLDALLLRPVSSLVLCSIGKLNVQDIPKIVLALALGGWAVAAGGGPASWVAAVAAAVAVASALVLMWAVGVLTNYKSISQERFDGSFALFAVHNLARVPVSFYGPVLRVVLTAVIPVAFFATVPAQVLFGTASIVWAGAAAALAAAAIVVTSWLWRRELSRYTGAMG